ncbi:MAG TPA: DegV family protein [Xanthomonadaceae bacterium]|jgi:DegV family protein with EDD domain|nr:DegV family protein [Xanthomonadaceae bacterium]
MRIGITVDSSCDLPREWLDAHNVVVLPTTIKIDNLTFADERDSVATLRFYRETLGDRVHSALSIPFSSEQFREVYLNRLVTEYEFVFSIVISKTRSLIYENATKASHEILRYYHPIREKAGLKGIFQMRVIDSKSAFVGPAIAVQEGVRMIAAGDHHNAIRERLEFLADNTYAFMVPRDLFHLRASIVKRGDKSLPWFRAAIGTMLDIKPILQIYRGDTNTAGKAKGFDAAAISLFNYACERIGKGLLAPYVNLSYGGELEKLRALPGYDKVVRACEEHGAKLTEAVMSITAMVNVGEGALTIGFASPPHEPKFA